MNPTAHEHPAGGCDAALGPCDTCAAMAAEIRELNKQVEVLTTERDNALAASFRQPTLYTGP